MKSNFFNHSSYLPISSLCNSYKKFSRRNSFYFSFFCITSQNK
nr:MAG TPA: hypothetical protein [Bacteriophage sp.]